MKVMRKHAPCRSWMVLAAILLLPLFVGCDSCKRAETEPPPVAKKKLASTRQMDTPPMPSIMVGWIKTWPGLAQVVSVLSYTNIFDLNKADVGIKGFSNARPLMRLIKSKKAKLLMLPEQAALQVMAQEEDYKILAQLTKARVAVVLPADTEAKALADLKGKSILVPEDSTATFLVKEAIKAAGLAPEDITIKAEAARQIIGIMRKGPDKGKWGDADAVVMWDPLLAKEEKGNKIKAFDVGTMNSYLLASSSFVKENQSDIVGFVKSLVEAYVYYAKEPARAHDWITERARKSFDKSLLERQIELEPNFKVTSIAEVNLSVSEETLGSLKRLAEFMAAGNGLDKAPDLAKAVDPGPLTKAMEELSQVDFNKLAIKIKPPEELKTQRRGFRQGFRARRQGMQGMGGGGFRGMRGRGGGGDQIDEEFGLDDDLP